MTLVIIKHVNVDLLLPAFVLLGGQGIESVYLHLLFDLLRELFRIYHRLGDFFLS